MIMFARMLFLCFSTRANLRHVFKMPAFGTYACLDSWMPLVNGCVNCSIALFNGVPKNLNNWKEWVMQQTKYCNNVLMTSVLGRKINKQIRTRETAVGWHEAYYSCYYMNVKLYSWLFTFHKVVRQQIWVEVVVLISSFTTDPFWI